MVKIAAEQAPHKTEEAFLSTAFTISEDSDVDIDRVLEQHREWVYLSWLYCAFSLHRYDPTQAEAQVCPTAGPGPGW